MARLLAAIGACVSVAAVDPAERLVQHVLATSKAGDVAAALNTFTDFSESRGLGMHLGSEKTRLLELAVNRGLPTSGGPSVVLEFGCHAGDGTLSAAAALSKRPGSVLVSTEGNHQWLQAAAKIVQHATQGTETKILMLPFKETDVLHDFLDSLAEKHIKVINTVIFDHDEKLFLPQLKALVARGLLQKGATVYVDNVKRKAAQLRKYMDHVSTRSGRGFVTEVTRIERPYPDEVAISTYVGDAEL